MSDLGTSCLESLSILNMLLNRVSAGNREQLHKSIADDVYQGLNAIITKIGPADSPMWVPDFMASLKDYQDSEATYLTNKMKETITEALYDLKSDVSKICYKYYETHDFTPTEKIIPILRDVVKLHYED